MAKKLDIIEPYFSHDINARMNRKIVKMFFEFRKNKKTFDEQSAKDLLPFAAYGLYWSVVEYMHKNRLNVSEVEVLADEFRIEPEILKTILNDYELFQMEEDYYINDRINQNITQRKVSTGNNQEAAKVRWLLSAYNTAYESEFGIAPILDSAEKQKLIEYSKKIDNFKELLPDILFTLHGIKFDNGIKFNPASNWLLTGNNLAQIVNGQYGKLKHRKSKAELEAEKKQAQEIAQEENADTEEFNAQVDSICNKIDAIKFIVSKTKYTKGAKLVIIPPLRKLKEKFGIDDKEILEYMKE